MRSQRLAAPNAMTKAGDFSEWYNDIVERAELIDKRYPIKGMDVWRPYGWSIMRSIDTFTRAEMDHTGHDEVMFPVFIPEKEFMKEAEQIKGFGGEVYWVTKGGDNDLDEPLVIRPTSETAMYPMFALWCRSHKDLPLKVYQIVEVFRYETKQTRSFLRVRQIHFFEAHTAHVDEADAERQIREDEAIWARLAEKLCLPYIVHKRPDWDKFPGAWYTEGADVVLFGNTPGERRTLQIATFHHYRDNFAKAYDIKYEDPTAGPAGPTHRYAHQTTYGMSERLLGAIVAVHGDDKGLMVPPAVAPYQAVVVPILFKGKEAGVLDGARDVAARLRSAGFRVHIDDSEETAGFKYNHWEMKGVPVRVEVGPRDLDRRQAVLVRRDSGEKRAVPLAGLAAEFQATLDATAKGMLERATKLLEESLAYVKTLDQAKDAAGIARVGWCGEEKCGLEIQNVTAKSVLGIPLGLKKAYKNTCVVCGKETTTPVDVAKAY